MKQTLYCQKPTDIKQRFKPVFEVVHHETSYIWMEVIRFCSFATLIYANPDGQTKRAILPPDWEQQIRVMVGFIPSGEQAHCRRSSAVRQQCCCGRGCFVTQVNKYLLNNCWVFDTGNQLDKTVTSATFNSMLEGPQLAVKRPSLKEILDKLKGR